jgi:hypothetical protein
VPVLVIWALTEIITSVARQIGVIARRSSSARNLGLREPESPLWVINRHPGDVRVMSVIPLKADIHLRGLHVCLVP